MKFLIASDFHGNTEHVAELLAFSQDNPVDIFVYAGDLGPMRSAFPSIQQQYEFIREKVIIPMAQIKAKYRFIMPGNTDFLPVILMLKKEFFDPEQLCVQQDGSVIINNQELLFLSTVSYTDHCLKDTEAINEYGDPKETKRRQQVSQVFSRVQSIKSEKPNCKLASDTLHYDLNLFEMYDNFDALPDEYKKRFLDNTLYKILNKYARTASPLLFSHCPPIDTNADVCGNKTKNNHCGSQDIRKFIEERSVAACFCGHIHESFLLTGQYESAINSTKVYSTGNTGINTGYCDVVAFLLYDSEKETCERIVKKCPGKYEYKFRVEFM